MFKIIALTSGLLLSQFSIAEPCFGPGGCSIDTPSNPQLCLNSVCTTIEYTLISVPGTHTGPAPAPVFALAFSTLDGYPIMGYSGPCMSGWSCPSLYDSAYQSLYNTASIINRHNRYINGY